MRKSARKKRIGKRIAENNQNIVFNFHDYFDFCKGFKGANIDYERG